MTITEAARHQLFQALEEILGREQAVTLMEHLPPVGWADVATKRDLDHLRAASKQDIERLRADFDRHRAATKQDLEHLGDVLRIEIGAMADRVRADAANSLRVQSHGIVGANAAFMTLAVGLTQLLT